MFISIKKILITTIILVTALFGCSTILASRVLATPMGVNPVINFYPEAIQGSLIGQTINKFNPKISPRDKEIIITAILKESKATNIDPLLITSVIAAESSFHPKAVSPCEACGLMQITSCVSQIMKISNPFDIQQNIYAGTRYLQDLFRQFDQFELILAAYNAGPTRVARLGRVPRITETINYIQRVSRFYQKTQTQLLSTISNLIGQPIFNPISSFLECSQSLKIVMGLSHNDSIGQPVLIEQDCCETKRTTRLMFNV